MNELRLYLLNHLVQKERGKKKINNNNDKSEKKELLLKDFFQFKRNNPLRAHKFGIDQHRTVSAKFRICFILIAKIALIDY